MVSREDLYSAELEPVRVSKSPTTVVTANGEVLTKEEATVHVRELDLFVTVKLLEDTPAVLSFGKLCEDHAYSYHWISGQKPQLIKNGRQIECNTAKYVPFVVPGLSTSSSSSSSPQEAVNLHSILHQQEVRVRVMEYKETRRMDQQKPKTKIKMTTKEYGETRCVISQNDKKSSSRILWMIVSQNTQSHPVLLMNCLQSREQNWYLASVVFSFTFRKTETATSA